MLPKIAINGFGRIGRTLTRLLLGPQAGRFRIAVVNSAEPVATAAFLLQHDSTAGPFPGEVRAEGEALVVNGQRIPFLQRPQAAAPFAGLDLDAVVEASGAMTDGRLAQAHLDAGARKVLITASASHVDATLCHGVNHALYDPARHHLVSSASCTTNCVAPVLAVIDRAFGIERAMASFLHSYTSGQLLLDGPHRDPRRARAALLSIIPADTTATHQVPLVLPSLAGRFTGIALRVPTEVVHLADLTMELKTPATVPDVRETIRRAAHDGMAGIVALCDEPLVSRDFRGSTHSSIVDGPTVTVVGSYLKLNVWHDNEHAYCCRVVDLLGVLCGIAPRPFPGH